MHPVSFIACHRFNSNTFRMINFRQVNITRAQSLYVLSTIAHCHFTSSFRPIITSKCYHIFSHITTYNVIQLIRRIVSQKIRNSIASNLKISHLSYCVLPDLPFSKFYFYSDHVISSSPLISSAQIDYGLVPSRDGSCNQCVIACDCVTNIQYHILPPIMC